MTYFINPITNKRISIYSKEAEYFFLNYIENKKPKNSTKKNINNYSQKGGSKEINLIYMAKPPYGGWVSFTAHLARKYNANLYKIGNKTEMKNSGDPTLRDFGYGVKYQNLSIEDASNLPNVLITAIDKNYYKYLDNFPNNTSLVIHDPTEIKGKSTQPVLDNLSRFNVITIRETVHNLLRGGRSEPHGFAPKKNTFLVHPFFEYNKSEVSKNKAVAISRIDFDKHTEMIIQANQILESKGKNPVNIYGAKNDLYVYHHLKNKLNLDLDRYYKGTFKKGFSEVNNLLKDAKFVVDMSAIKGDGGGSQYTFLEAIYQGCALVLNSKWVEGVSTPFKHGYNCFVVSNEKELANLLASNPDTRKITQNAKKLLDPHVKVDWRGVI
uniref:Glycosyl transferase family 1 domain-containing protein n=1 Tax=viral metagenome TaxID=1070528 RepID=A0A6C0JG55_9ZZZZ